MGPAAPRAVLVAGGVVGRLSAHDQVAIGGEPLVCQRRGIFTGEHGYRGGGFVGGERSGSAWRLGISELGRRPGGAGGGASECPGASAVTAIPSLPSPTASVRVIPISAPFDAT
jgi:hypothetical protein